MSEKQQKIIHMIIFVIGIISLLLFLHKNYLWAGTTFVIMGVLGTVFKIKGGEFCVVIGLIPILLHFQKMRLLMVWNLIILLIALYDGVVLLRVSKDLISEDKKERQKEFNEQFRQKELVHVFFVKFIRCLGFSKSQSD